jgi:hypothetical protein
MRDEEQVERRALTEQPNASQQRATEECRKDVLKSYPIVARIDVPLHPGRRSSGINHEHVIDSAGAGIQGGNQGIHLPR